MPDSADGAQRQGFAGERFVKAAIVFLRAGPKDCFRLGHRQQFAALGQFRRAPTVAKRPVVADSLKAVR